MKKNKQSEETSFSAPSNLLDAFEQVLRTSRNSQLSEKYLEEMSTLLQFISEKMGITPRQSVLLAIILEGGRYGQTSLKELAGHLDCSIIRLYNMSEDLDMMLKKRIIWRSTREFRMGDEEKYGVTKNALEIIKKGGNYTPPSLHCDDNEDFFVMMDDIYGRRDDDMLSEDEMQCEIADVCAANQELPVVQSLRKWSELLNEQEIRVMILFCLYHLKDDDEVAPRQLAFIFDDRNRYQKLRSQLNNKTSLLLKKGAVEVAKRDSMMMTDSYCLTEKAMTDFFPAQVECNKKRGVKSEHLDSYKKIAAKTLYYNDEDRSQIDVLSDFLAGNHLKQVQSRLAKNGMRTGVCCLLYGGPGTGKTATVLELARSTKRDIYQVNLSDLRSKWVGESERICQELWDDYNRCVAQSRRAPILLLNECDGILTSRKHGAQNSVDKMENTLANIFLENMEKQRGIVIATTNLADNLDPAFNRRFIYKIRLGKPCFEARRSIWQSMLNGLGRDDAGSIAGEYDFSGGQIENIARKYMIDHVLTGQELTIGKLREYCRQEHLQTEMRKAIGFAKQ